MEDLRNPFRGGDKRKQGGLSVKVASEGGPFPWEWREEEREGDPAGSGLGEPVVVCGEGGGKRPDPPYDLPLLCTVYCTTREARPP